MKSRFALLVLGMSSFLCVSCTTCHKPPEGLCSGTKKPYQINGVWYYPQEDYNYAEKGIASWYGPGFHGRPKACGGKYNMHGMSAAHKTLPIPSVVRVTNLSNGRSVKLVVDDRGPFVGERIIDLSKTAAHALGTHGAGLAEVHVEALPDESKALSDYLSQFGRYGRDPSGRDWYEIYQQEIEGKSAHHLSQIKPIPVSHSKKSPPKTRQPKVISTSVNIPLQKKGDPIDDLIRSAERELNQKNKKKKDQGQEIREKI
jgi:rare lipoprotein A